MQNTVQPLIYVAPRDLQPIHTFPKLYVYLYKYNNGIMIVAARNKIRALTIIKGKLYDVVEANLEILKDVKTKGLERILVEQIYKE